MSRTAFRLSAIGMLLLLTQYGPGAVFTGLMLFLVGWNLAARVDAAH